MSLCKFGGLLLNSSIYKQFTNLGGRLSNRRPFSHTYGQKESTSCDEANREKP